MSAEDGRLRGLAFAKQFPNPAEPLRGLFVAEQLDATRAEVDWSVIAPVPWVPRFLAPALGKPYVRGGGEHEGLPVDRPRYPVLPRRILYSSVAPLVARSSRTAFLGQVRAHGTQFVHAHALYPSAAAARRLSAPAGLPLVVTIHGSDLYTNVVRPAWERELRQVVDAAAAVVCVSERLALDAVAMLGADPARTLVIPDTYDEEMFRAAPRTPPRTDTASGLRPLELVTVGRLVPEKGHTLLLEALSLLAEDGRDARLTIVGGGPMRADLAARAAELGVASCVTLAGALPPERLLQALHGADLYVLPSLREGFGVALVEGMATGLPAVATRSGGPQDIVTAESGALVEPGDAVALAEGIREMADRLASFDPAAIADSIRARFSKAAVGGRLVTLYREIVAGEPLTGTMTSREARR